MTKNGFMDAEGQRWVLDRILQSIDNVQYWAERIKRREEAIAGSDTLDEANWVLRNAGDVERMVLTWLDNMEVMA